MTIPVPNRAGDVNGQVDFLEDFDPGQISDQGGMGDSEMLKGGHHGSNGYGDMEGEPSPYARQPY